MASVVLLVAGCAEDTSEITESGIQKYPDIVGASFIVAEDGTYRFDVTVSSPYDSDVRYADAWRVKDSSGTVYGIRELTHPHADEQPFTRSLTGVEIPPEVATVTLEGRDLVNGWGGQTFDLSLR
jgi:hypothetical protein